MTQKRETIVLATFCLVVVLLSVVGLIWAIALGFPITLDRILLLLVCLLMGGVFSLQVFLLARRAGWLEMVRFSRRKAVAEATAAAPASATENPDKPSAEEAK